MVYGNILGESETQSEDEGSKALENLLLGKSDILLTQLEILASSIVGRVRIRGSNLESIQQDYEKACELLKKTSREINYLFRERRDAQPLYDLLLDLKRQKRSEASECWRDVAGVMRDFLNIFEAWELARRRARFFQ